MITLLCRVMTVTVCATACEQPPPRYEVTLIENDPSNFNYWVKANNHGQVVYDVWFDGGNTDGIDIFFYDNGVTTRLTDDNVYDRQPYINEDGTIVWSRATNGPGSPSQIVMLRDGVLTQLTNSVEHNIGPRINNLGQVAWYRLMGNGPCSTAYDIFWFDGQTVRRISSDSLSEGVSNQGAVVNDDGWIVWTRYDFCNQPWTSDIRLFRNGVTEIISPPGTLAPTVPDINNRGQAAWYFLTAVGAPRGVHLWENGTVLVVTNNGGGPQLNDNGALAFWRYYSGGPTGAYETWLYSGGRFQQLTSNRHDLEWNNVWSLPLELNERGEVFITQGQPWYYTTTISLLRPRVTDAPVTRRPLLDDALGIRVP